MRKVRLNIIILIALALLTQASWATTTFDPSLVAFGARPLGLGGAFIGLADDTNAVFLNPAGIAALEQWSMTSMYTSILDTVDYNLLGGTYKTDYGTFGIGYIGTSSPAGYRTGASSTEVFEKISYGTSTFIFSYANYVNELIDLDFLPENTLIGANLKMQTQGLTDSDSYSGTGYNLDLAVLSSFSERAKVGATLTNAIPNTMAWSSDLTESMPSALNIGGAFNVMEGDQPLTAVADARLDFESGLTLHGGLEWKPMEYLSIRCGVDEKKAEDAEKAISSVYNLTAGIGFMYEGVSFDYAYCQDGYLTANQTHYFSISYSPALKKPEAKKTAEYKVDEYGYIEIGEKKKKNIDLEKELEVDLEQENNPDLYVDE